MRREILIIYLLAIVGVFFSCSEKDNVSYEPCPCEEEKHLAGMQFKQGNAYLFKDFVPDEMSFIEQTEPLNKASWIVFDSKTNKATLTVREGVLHYICQICNFPDFVKDWNIPQNGCEVYFEGATYEPCEQMGGIGTFSGFDYILTKLKTK